jgi:arylsulfatase A-like enzyme
LLIIAVWATEGGIRCPSIIAYPALGAAGNGVIRHDMTTVMDILPTIVSLLLLVVRWQILTVLVARFGKD